MCGGKFRQTTALHAARAHEAALGIRYRAMIAPCREALGNASRGHRVQSHRHCPGDRGRGRAVTGACSDLPKGALARLRVAVRFDGMTAIIGRRPAADLPGVTLKLASTATPFSIRFALAAASTAHAKVPLTRDGHCRGGMR